MSNYTTSELTGILSGKSPSSAAEFVSENKSDMILSEKPFAQYIRDYTLSKHIFLQDVLIKADISEGYGYKILSENKRTRKRDIILRITVSLGMTLDEIQKALKLYNMSPLYSRVPRDAVLISCISNGMHDIYDISDELVKAGFEPLEQ